MSVDLPDVARTLLKGVIVALGNAGLITAADAARLIEILELSDA